MAAILIGTCSWTDKELVGSGWYPPGVGRDAAARLRHYAGRFPVVEVDATYYALPSTRNSLLWTERTPPGFRFDVKAFSLLTGHPTRQSALPAGLRGRDREDPGLVDEVWHRFSSALLPLRDAGRLGTLLFQYPPWFTPGARAETVLHRMRKRTAGWPVAVEFRHADWWREDRRARTAALLRDLDAAAVAVDTAQALPGSLPPIAPVTSRHLAVVRFHGRSAAWGTGSKEDRFRHTYTEKELREWRPRLEALADRAAQLHVLFNNCCGDSAVRAAETMRQVLAAPGAPGDPAAGQPDPPAPPSAGGGTRGGA